MITVNDAQIIIDHYHTGKISKFEDYPLFYKVKTNQGVFFILESSPQEARNTEESRQEFLEKIVGTLKRLLLADYKGNLQEDSSYAHYKDMYFSVYKLVKERL